MTAAIALRAQGVQPELVELDPHWAPLGVGLLLQGPPLRALRCRTVVENSVLLGEWEQHPGTPGAEPGRVVGETFALLAQPK